MTSICSSEAEVACAGEILTCAVLYLTIGLPKNFSGEGLGGCSSNLGKENWFVP